MDVVKLVEVTRGNMVESCHRGVFAVVDESGKVIASGGSLDYFTYLRSSAKPMQALPVVESGATKYFDFTDKELAILTSSHSGEDEHRETVYSILQKINLDPSYLHCGTHPPLYRPIAKKLQEKGLKPDVLHCSCSGKHAAMLTLAQYKGWKLDDYYSIEHPVQQTMLEVMSELTDTQREDIIIGIDGCGVPVYGMPIYNMALAYARFVKPIKLSNIRQEACNKLSKAMVTYPKIVAGTGRFCSDLMEFTQGKIVAKDGTEGVFCFGIPSKGWGVAIKVEDGNMRALGPVVVGLLEQLEILSTEELAQITKLRNPQIKNFRQEIIGELRPVIKI